MGVRIIDYEKCNGCGICVETCPMDVLRMNQDKGKAYIKYLRDCQSCFLCEIDCPTEAITCLPVFERRMIPAW